MTEMEIAPYDPTWPDAFAAERDEELKRQLAPLHGAATFASRQAYADAKTVFVNRVTERAMAEGFGVPAHR